MEIIVRDLAVQPGDVGMEMLDAFMGVKMLPGVFFFFLIKPPPPKTPPLPHPAPLPTQGKRAARPQKTDRRRAPPRGPPPPPAKPRRCVHCRREPFPTRPSTAGRLAGPGNRRRAM